VALFDQINPNILLQFQQPDYAGSYGEGFKLGTLMRQAPMVEQMDLAKIQQQNLMNQEAQLKLADLMNPMSTDKLLEAEKLKYLQQQGTQLGQTIASEKEKQRLAEEENARRRLISTSADQFYDTEKKTFDYEGFLNNAVTIDPFVTNKELVEIANKYKYGFGQPEKSEWQPWGDQIKSGGKYYQPEKNSVTGETRFKDTGLTYEEPKKAPRTEIRKYNVDGKIVEYVVNKDTGEPIKPVEYKGKALTPAETGAGRYIELKELPSAIRPFFKQDQDVPKKALENIQLQTSAVQDFIRNGEKAKALIEKYGIRVLNSTTKEAAQLSSIIGNLGNNYRVLKGLGVPNANDAELITNFLGDPQSFKEAFKQSGAKLEEALKLMEDGYNSTMQNYGFKTIPRNVLLGTPESTKGLIKFDPKLPVKTDAQGRNWQLINGKVTEVQK